MSNKGKVISDRSWLYVVRLPVVIAVDHIYNLNFKRTQPRPCQFHFRRNDAGASDPLESSSKNPTAGSKSSFGYSRCFVRRQSKQYLNYVGDYFWMFYSEKKENESIQYVYTMITRIW